MGTDLEVREQADECARWRSWVSRNSARDRGIGQLHRGIAERVFSALGPKAAVVRLRTTASRTASTRASAARRGRSAAAPTRRLRCARRPSSA